MIQFYVVDDLQRNELNIAHFDKLRDAVRAYTALSTANRKALGVQCGGDAVDLVQCLPLHPGEQGGEDVMVLEVLEHPMWKSRPQLLISDQDLAARLFIRYCLFQGCLLPVPDRDVLPRALRNKYLWPDQPDNFYTAAQWVHVAGVGRLSPAEFKRRFVVASSASLTPPQAGEFVHSAAPPLPTKPEGRLCGDPAEGSAFSYPLVTKISAFGVDKRGHYRSLQVTPWEFHLLARRSRERLDKNKHNKGEHLHEA